MKNMVNLKKIFLTILVGLVPLTSFAEAVAPARIAELAAHRIDRLVGLQKIDASFNSRTERIDVIATGPAPIAFKALVSQKRPAQGEPLQVEIFFDAAAKPLSFNTIAGGVIGSDPQWTDADAVSLLEHSLHEVLENSTDTQVGPFYTGLSSITLTKETFHEEIVARVQITSGETEKKLNIYFKLDGSFISSEILP